MKDWKTTDLLVPTILMATVSAFPLMAEELEEDESYSLGEITVSGTGLPTEVFKSPASVTVVTQEDIKKVPPKSVADILANVPGVRVTESGIERISIRGESSQRVAIMIDGQRISDHTTYGTPILISPTEIERIEVVRGSSSVVSGNRAIGGVVNIITKRGADKPAEVTLSGGYLGANEGYRGSASLAGTVGNFDYRLSYSKSELGDRVTPNGPLVPSGGADRDISAFAGYRFGNHYVGVRAQDFDLSADVYTGFGPSFTIDLPKRDMRKYSAFYEGVDLTPWLTALKVDAYTQTIDRQFINYVAFGPPVTSTSDDKARTSGFKAVANMEFAPGHRTVVGFEYEDDGLVTDKTRVPTTGAPSQSRADASTKTASIFGQHEIEFNSALTGTFGLRYYDVSSRLNSYVVDGTAQPGQSNSDGRGLGAAGLVWTLNEETILRANLSQGYTYPSLSQLYLTSSGAGGIVIGNPSLRPETSTNFEIGARIDRSNLVLDAAVFYTQAEDYITTVGIGGGSSIYQNVDAADSWGFELAAEYDPNWWGGIRPYVSVSNVTREFKYANGFTTQDSGTPNWSGDLGLRGDWYTDSLSGTWDLFARGESGATERDNSGAIVDQTTGWTTLNLRGSVQVTRNVNLNFEVGNIFDKSYRAMDQIEGPGRYASVFVTAVF